MVFPRTARGRGTEIIHLVIFSPEAPELYNTRQGHQNYPFAIFLNHLPVGEDGVAGCWSSSNMSMLPLPSAELIQLGTYTIANQENVFMEEITLAKEKGKVIRLILSNTFCFQFNSFTEDRKAD